jgi:uncharacterized protein YcnI
MYRATLRVGHGCDGALTTGIQVTIPAGFNGAQPMPKAGWTLSTRVGTLAEPYESHGTRYTEGVQEITWTATGRDSALPAAYYDEFVFRGTTPKVAGPLWFKIRQLCDKGTNEWVEVPASGSATQGLKFPAARLEVLAEPQVPVQSVPASPNAGGHAH